MIFPNVWWMVSFMIGFPLNNFRTLQGQTRQCIVYFVDFVPEESSK